MKKALALLLSLAMVLSLLGCSGVSGQTGTDTATDTSAVNTSDTETTLRYVEENVTPTLADGSSTYIMSIQGWADGSLDAFGYQEWYHSEDGGDTWETREIPEEFRIILCADDSGTLYGCGRDEEMGQYVFYRCAAGGETETIVPEVAIADSFLYRVIYDNRIILLEAQHEDWTSTLYAVELATGETLWERETVNYPICFCYDGAVYLYEDAYPMLALDPETGEALGEYGEDFMCNTNRPLLAEDGYYFFVDPDNYNLCRGIFDSQIYEVVLEASGYRYALDGADAVSVGSFYMDEDYTLYLITDSGNLYRFTSERTATAESSFTVWALYETDTLRETMLAFQQEHPELDVVLDVQLDDDGSTGSAATVSDLLSTLNTQLLAGDGPDVLILDGVDYENYIGKGVLESLNDIYQETDFVGGTVSGLLTEAGDCYVIPARFSVPVLMSSDEGETLPATMEELTERVLSGSARTAEQSDNVEWVDGAYLQPYPSGPFYSAWLAASGSALVTEDGVDTQALSAWLEGLKEISDHYNLCVWGKLTGGEAGTGSGIFDSGNRNEYFPSDAEWGDGTAGFMEMVDVQSLVGHMVLRCVEYDEETGEDMVTPYETDFHIVRFPGLTEGAYSPEILMAVSAGSSQTELAKEFIRTALSDDIQQYTYGDGLPVTQAGMDAQIDYFAPYARQCGWDISELETIFDGCTTPVSLELEMEDILYDAASQLCLGELDLEDAVAQIEDDLALKIAEK
ncbi:MAG: hypothetical protein LIO51_05825 [Clostridiales bacterium]|nr:hypothetical protein [Clostridiales bacterium]